MNLRPLIDDVASQADDFLAGIRDRTLARAEIAEFVALDFPKLHDADRKLVVDGVMAVLDDESFFGERFVDSFDTDQDFDRDSDS